ncbi:MAG TPA: hypothetical protein VFI29_14210 [Hanamia sp.]|nr:hypothetical protein [Hanamia sp.]
MENNKIEKAIERGLTENVFDLAIDYAELGLDTFMDNDAIKEIPIVKSVVGLVKGGIAIREIFLAKKLLTFLKEYHSGKIMQIKKEAFLQKFHDDKKYRESVVDQIMTLNDRFISIEKSKVLANLFLAHLNDKFDWEGFCQLSECLDDLHTRAFKILDDSANSKDPFHFSTFEEEKDGGGVLFSAGICIIHGNHYSVNTYGQYLYFYGIKGDIDFTFPITKQK